MRANSTIPASAAWDSSRPRELWGRARHFSGVSCSRSSGRDYTSQTVVVSCLAPAPSASAPSGTDLTNRGVTWGVLLPGQAARVWSHLLAPSPRLDFPGAFRDCSRPFHGDSTPGAGWPEAWAQVTPDMPPSPWHWGGCDPTRRIEAGNTLGFPVTWGWRHGVLSIGDRRDCEKSACASMQRTSRRDVPTVSGWARELVVPSLTVTGMPEHETLSAPTRAGRAPAPLPDSQPPPLPFGRVP